MNYRVPPTGAMVSIRRRRWKVERAKADGRILRLDVVDRGRRATFLAPFDRVVAGPSRARPRHLRPQAATAHLANFVARRAFAYRTILSGVDARARVLPYQLEPAIAVVSGTRRVLIADAPGLGKTVQAGLVIAELARRCGTIRALVIVPALLRNQWRRELEERFDVRAAIADRQSLNAVSRSLRGCDSPWDATSVWIASADFIKQPHVLDSIPLRPWDVVVIDEAHDVSGASDRHGVCDRIARRARHVLLLSATPHSGDETRFHRLVDLGRLSALDDTLTVFRRTRTELTSGPGRRVWRCRVRLSEAESAVLDTLRRFELATLAAAGVERRSDALLLLSVLRKRALSTMHALGVSVARRLAWLEAAPGDSAPEWLQPRFDFGFEADDDAAANDRSGLTAVTGLSVGHERTWLRRLERLADLAGRSESKLGRLERMVSRSREPLVVFTEFRQSLVVLARRLAKHRRVAVLHGGLSEAARQQALTQFLAGEVSVIVATDVAGQGLNLHSRSRWVASLELPWSPARLEQRVGRVDRIGQGRRVHATLLVARHDAEQGLLSRLAARALNAHLALSGGEADDTLESSQLRLAEQLLSADAQAPGSASPMRLVPCRRWQRPGRAMALNLRCRRAFGSRWRAAASSGAAPCWTVLGRLPKLRAAFPHGFAVLSVPIVDAAGNLVELAAIPVSCTGGLRHPGLSRQEADAALAVVRQRLRARTRRLERLVHGHRRQRAGADDAIATELREATRARRAQASLFDVQAVVDNANDSTAPSGTEGADITRSTLPGFPPLLAGQMRVEFMFFAHE